MNDRTPIACRLLGHRFEWGVMSSWSSVIVGRYYANGYRCERCGEWEYARHWATEISALPAL